ncbi:MAG: hypothetical protein QOJ07_2132, partial [Thermoleophilaceae bacterium]|nr:hypothetical protein [Thermoleophilaceae bacterium]
MTPEEERRGPREPELGQIACSTVSVLIRRVRATAGELGVERLLALADVPYSAEYLQDSGNWIWYDEALALIKAGAELTGDPHIGRRIGEETVRQHAGTAVATLLRSLGSPEAVYEQIAMTATKFSTVVALVPTSVEPGRAILQKTAHSDFQRHQHLCDLTAGMLSQPPALFGLPAASVEETSCELRGDPCCVYEVSWDAVAAARAADPQQLVTALEAQVTAMNDRLNSMYATARDLVASDDVDAALARITERAASEVRAPKYLLAVRVGEEGALHVHHRGYTDADAHAAAALLLDDPEVAGGGSAIVADVVSSDRFYGRLMATTSAVGFFTTEHDLLKVYASYAAAILDTATALDEARRLHKRSHALLELSRTLGAATTSDEVARRMADAVPAVVDCDRVSVLLWDEEERAVTLRAVSDASTMGFAPGAAQAVRPDERPELAAMLASPDPDPLFFSGDTDDPFISAAMGRTGAAALVVVPIVGHGRFYGYLSATVNERPERLERTPDLLDRLAGAVAQAATALDNARLIEKMAHQASHDNLTGLLGHRAFHEALDVAIADHETFALSTFDIDDFKRINDSEGHPVGDE